jgi:hypothetical protein
MIPRHLVDRYKLFGGTCSLHFPSSTLKTETKISSETLVGSNYNILEDGDLYNLLFVSQENVIKPVIIQTVNLSIGMDL